MGLGLAAGCVLAAGLIAANLWPAPAPVLVLRDAAIPSGPAAKAARLWPADAPGPTRAALAPDEWTSDAPAFQAKLAHRLVAAQPSVPPPPPAKQASAPASAPSDHAAQVSAPTSVSAPKATADDLKICRDPTVALDVPKAAALGLQLRYHPALNGKPLDIPPAGPPPEEERRIRLSALLAEALSQ
jgi:hypothetical protein